MHRNDTTDATSAGSPARRSGIREVSCSTASELAAFLTMSVMTIPGATELTRILSQAHSAARLLVSWFTPPIDVQTDGTTQFSPSPTQLGPFEPGTIKPDHLIVLCRPTGP